MDDNILFHIEKKLNVNVHKVEKVKRGRRELQDCYTIYTEEDEKYFLKFNRMARSKAHRIVRMMFGNPGFDRQLKVYEILGNYKFNVFQYPKMIHTDGKSYIILEYIEKTNTDITEKYKSALVKSFADLHTANLSIGNINGRLGIFLLNLSITIEFSLLKSVAPLLKYCGLRPTLRYLKIIISGYVKQNKMDDTVVLHNDLHRNNVFVSKTGNIYVTDFEGLKNERRWLYTDIATYSVDTAKYCIDTDLLKKYVNIMKNKFADYEIDHAVQLRIGLLSRVSRFMYFKPTSDHVREKYKKYFLNTLLDDNNYYRWYRDSIEN